jgi:predicted permease
MGPGGREDTSKYPNLVTKFYNPLIEKLQHAPGIQTVGVTTVRPFSPSHFDLTIWPASQAEPAQKDKKDAQARASNPDYFRTMGIALVKGRGFADTDRPGGSLAVIVNQEFVRRILNGYDPLGTQLKWDDSDKHLTATIVGVIADIHQDSARQASIPEIYFDLDQLKPGQDMYGILVAFHVDLAIRTVLAPEVAFRAVGNVVHEFDPNLALADQTTMQDVVDNSLGSQTLAARLLGLFGLAALLIAVAGIYGLLAYSVSQRTREMGVRIALGAQRADILWMVLRHAVVLMGIGVAIGLGVVWVAGGVLRSYLYGAAVYDVATVLLVVLVLGASGIAASYLPARRAAGVNPVEALRSE